MRRLDGKVRISFGIATRKEQYRARNFLVQQAETEGADFLLMIDDDQPLHVCVDIIEKFYELGQPIAGGLYWQRGGWRLQDALARALMYNPELAASSWEVHSGTARADQARLYPNPELEVEIEEFGGSREEEGSGRSSDSLKRFEGAETTVKMSQLLELGGKRSKRTRVATLEHSVLGWDYEARRLTLITEVTNAFIELLALQKRLVLI